MLVRGVLIVILAFFVFLAFLAGPQSDDYGTATIYASKTLVTCKKMVENKVEIVDFPCNRYYNLSLNNHFRPAGLTDMLVAEYLTMSGRYFTNFLVFTITGAAASQLGPHGAIQAYFILPLLLLAVFFYAFRKFARAFGYDRQVVDDKRLAWASLTFMLIYLIHMPRIAAGLYWWTGILMHELCIALSLILFSWLLTLPNMPSGTRKRILWVAAFLLSVNVVASTEVILLLTGGTLFFSMLVATRIRSSIARGFQWLMVVTILSGIAVIFAPGTSARSSQDAIDAYQLIPSLKLSIEWSARYILSWIFTPDLILATLIALPFAIRVVNDNRFFDLVRLPHLLAYGFLLFGLIWFCWFLIAFIGRQTPLRVVNSIYLYFLIGWFVGIHLALAAFNIKMTPKPLSRPYAPALLSGLLILCFFIPGGGFLRPANNLITGLKDLQGPIWEYKKQLNQRYALFKKAANDPTAEQDLIVKPFSNPPDSLFYEDITPNTRNWRNDFMARYFGIHSVTLEEP